MTSGPLFVLNKGVQLAGYRYAVDPSLIGRRIELRFDPEDLTRMEVFGKIDRSVRRSHSSLGATCAARCLSPSHLDLRRPPASITWAWSWPSMTTTCWARSPTATCHVPPTTSGHDPHPGSATSASPRSVSPSPPANCAIAPAT